MHQVSEIKVWVVPVPVHDVQYVSKKTSHERTVQRAPVLIERELNGAGTGPERGANGPWTEWERDTNGAQTGDPVPSCFTYPPFCTHGAQTVSGQLDNIG